MKRIYDLLGGALAPLDLQLDYEQIKARDAPRLARRPRSSLLADLDLLESPWDAATIILG
jgi:hypothetical protein